MYNDALIIHYIDCSVAMIYLYTAKTGTNLNGDLNFYGEGDSCENIVQLNDW
jgi:hypothetical protein